MQAAMSARLRVRSVTGTTPAATAILSERRVSDAMITMPNTPKSAAGGIAKPSEDMARSLSLGPVAHRKMLPASPIRKSGCRA